MQALFPQNADLDASTLGKPGNQAIPQQDNLPVQTSYGQGLQEDRALAEFEEAEEEQLEEAAMLDLMLSLRGGAAMKAMKSPRPSEMKKKKPMNAYMTKLQEARKSVAKSFEYNGKTYVA